MCKLGEVTMSLWGAGRSCLLQGKLMPEPSSRQSPEGHIQVFGTPWGAHTMGVSVCVRRGRGETRTHCFGGSVEGWDAHAKP